MLKAQSLLVAFILYFTIPAVMGASSLDSWSDTERVLINSLLIDNLDSPPPDPSNKYANNQAAAKLGERIFNDPRFSANGRVSCSSCHRADYDFTDKLALARGLGTSQRRSMPVRGMAYQRWFFWDGRKDSLWSQALAPLEDAAEHGISRTRVVQIIYKHYRNAYQTALAPLPNINPENFSAIARPDAKDLKANEQWQAISEEKRDKITRVFVNTGKAIAAFVQTLKPGPAAFDHYARSLNGANQEALNSLNSQQKRGLRLFVGKAKCISCHNGPLLTNGEFHHVGIPDKTVFDFGRSKIIGRISKNEFSCLGRWSDADIKKDCAHVRFMDVDAARYLRAFKTPTLRNVATRPPYMHAGQFNSLSEVLNHYRDVSGTALADEVFHNDLTDDELEQLEAFLKALTSLDHVGYITDIDKP